MSYAKTDLKELLLPLKSIQVHGVTDGIAVKGLTADSRKVRPGYIYAALPGQKFDGHAFIKDAVTNGAVAVLCSVDTDSKGLELGNVPVLKAENTRLAFAKLAAQFFGAAPENIVAITGTNGKTSVVHYTRGIWQALGLKAASLGTLGVESPGRVSDGRMTTLDPANLHAELLDLQAVGVTHLAMEASSHGLDQYRLDGVHLKSAAFTNLTQDHLDYHEDMETYFKAKKRLFTELLDKDNAAVINADDPYGAKLIKILKDAGHKNIVSYGKDSSNSIAITNIEPTNEGQNITIKIGDVQKSVTIDMVGAFQTYNLCAAIGLVMSATNVKIEDILETLPILSAPRGRLQNLKGHKKGAGVFVDYAHTPDALSHILRSLRVHTKNKLIVVFGCGGDRDKGKRPKMAKIACDHADHVIITDDNPRHEEPSQIRRELVAACPKAEDIGNRAYAIHKAVRMAGEGDIVVIAGKGHERGQIIGDNVYPFDDLVITQEAIDAVE